MPASHPAGGGDQVLLRADDLYLRFGGMMALSGVSLGVKDGEILAIIGPNGAGKTCTLNCINGFYRPQRGEIFFQGKRITPLPPHRIAELGISRTFQNIELFTGLSTLDNLMAARHIHMRRGALAGFLYFGPMRREEIAHRKVVEDIIDFLELEPARKRTVGLLPYGLRKRVELARAVAIKPQILLLDEPSANLDPRSASVVENVITRVSHELGTTIILASHNIGQAKRLASKVATLEDGVLVNVSTSGDLLETFGRFQNIFSGHAVTGDRGITPIDIGSGVKLESANMINGPVTVSIRPEEIVVSKIPIESSARNVFKGKVTEASDRDNNVQLKVDVGREFTALITRKSFDEMQVNIGSDVYLVIKAQAIQVTEQ